jgi:uncharacterized protein YjbI with pentapeptide repeats
VPAKRSTSPQAPDVIDDRLGPWEPAPLATGFVIEHARVDGGVGFADLRVSGGRVEQSRLDGVSMTGSRLRSLTLLDAVFKDVDASNADWTGARLKRVVFDGCRMTGFGGFEVEAEDVLFRNCQLHLASFRRARMRRVMFESCLLDEADFAGVSLSDSRFAGSQVRRADFNEARLVRVDFRGSALEEPRGDVRGLRGAIIDPVQLVGLAATIADGLGIVVEER